VRARSGGQIVEQATHVLDLLRFVAGEVSEVSARGARTARATFPSSDIQDATAATLMLENGAVGALVTTCLLSRKHRAGLELFCDGMALELSEAELVVRHADGPQSQAVQTSAKTLVDRDFINAVKGGENLIRAPYEEALVTQRLACAIATAAETGPPPTSRGRAARGATANGDTVRSLGVQRAGKAAFFDVPIEPSGDGRFRVDTLYTGLSAGTELTFFKGTNPALHTGWDAELGLFRPDRPARTYPVETMGYMEVARVAEPGGDAAAPGECVAMAYGHKTAHCVDPTRDRFAVLPDDLDPLLGIYVAHMGPICANGLLHAASEVVGRDVRMLGDGVHGLDVVVIGAGVVGLLTALFALHHGAAAVTVADSGPRRLRAARALGFDVIDENTGDVARHVKARYRHGACDRGADVAFQCRARAESLAAALRSLRPQGAVIDLAFYTAGAAALRLGDEFHHNGLAVRCAQIGRVPRGLAPLWNRDRLCAETIELLRAHGDAIRREIVTDVVPLAAAPQLLDDLAARRREVIQAVFEVSA
jgi:threonine dehydrogenase-like Zn-dependent dehydrogenase